MNKLIGLFLLMCVFELTFISKVGAAPLNEFDELAVYLDDYDFNNAGGVVSFADKRFSFSPLSIEEFKSGYIKDSEPDDLMGLYVSNAPAGGRLVSYSSSLNMKLLGLVGKAPEGVYIAMANMDVGFIRLNADGSIKDGMFVVHYFSDVRFGVRFHKAVRYIFDGAIFDSILSKMSEKEISQIFDDV